ncbi:MULTISPECIES: 16S rRNA (uracil(1498)-N(3))-methyltransferase [Bacillus]|uniref:Ribosomal RNA small subunit methyltransferase E n=2 Tax=Bacillus TaxID=1386 RepID=A0A0M3R9M3_9BACI|nr:MULTISPECIES: 16S rRNA (uracil(1498)-N(3))-methyltransferase [Bacillus]ALC81676.1 16S rRNA methyltransferase [Bacillus gobiensis]MBP1080726.1 16S rRNA (uracil1498-N3)-methyltransferase [Bacillus capparidis]MED1094582.1 16S rRNA (uracil(1498)-N(3))-methyltransferase [Bacillus capparidis]
MQRYFIEQKKEQVNSAELISITGEDVHHISHVMRMQPGDHVICMTKDGFEAVCLIEAIFHERIDCKVEEWTGKSRELPLRVNIASGLLKGDKYELVLQKGTELGACSFLSFQSKRSIVKLDEKKAVKKLERWKKIVKEAAEQSYRSLIPHVEPLLSFNVLLNRMDEFDTCIVAYEESSKEGEASEFYQVLKRSSSDSSILFLFGPEGGFDSEEIKALKEKGAVVCGLGPRILRAETAPLYALSAISYHTELARGEQ